MLPVAGVLRGRGGGLCADDSGREPEIGRVTVPLQREADILPATRRRAAVGLAHGAHAGEGAPVPVEYPISRYLRLYTVRPPQGSLKQFIDWVLGPGGQQVVGEMGYVPLFELD